jgi:uncharacterized protein (TIGR02246 family)
MHIRFVRLAVSLLFAAAFAFAQGDADGVVRGMADRWAASFNEGDYQAVADLYTADAIFADAFGRFEGQEEILEGLATKLPVPVGEATIDISTEEVEIYDDVASSTGSYAISVADGSTMMQGSWLAVSKLVDGEWKMYRHVASMLLPPPEPEADVQEAAYDLAARWAELYNADDLVGVANLYTEDAIVVNMNGRRDIGREAIYVGLATPMPEPLDQGIIEVITEEAEVLGDTANGMGTFFFWAPDGTTVFMQGTYVAISKLVDGEWKMHRHIVNLLMPEPEAEAP